MSADKLILEVIFEEISYNLKNIGKIREKKGKGELQGTVSHITCA